MKRHVKQNHKQKHGQYFTTNSATLLEGYEHVVRGRSVTEPFAGGGDLTQWCLDNGATEVIQYDIEPTNTEILQNDSILRPVLDTPVVVTNPPYLSKNKNKDKTAYNLWEQNDLYKCHLAAIVANRVESGILILPSNFLSERHSRARDMFFSYYRMNKVKYYRTQVFEDATTGIVVFDFERWTPQSTMTCEYEIFYDTHSVKETYTSHEKYGWLVGEEFLQITHNTTPYKVEILREGMTSNSNIVIGLLDKGKYSLGAHYNSGDPIYCAPKAFTTYQCILPTQYTEKQQQEIVSSFNSLLNMYREQYHSLFLSNYMGAEQKILSRHFAERLLQRAASMI